MYYNRFMSNPNDLFAAKYSELNPQQKKAVDSLDGAVMLLAGPGSGKTQVLAMRIANIIRSTDTEAGSILALTYTDSAATNMSHRLAKLIGPAGYKVKTVTFHGFANELIREYPEHFIFARELTEIDDLSRQQILQGILDENEYKYIRTASSPYYFLKGIVENISILKKESYEPADYLKVVLENKSAHELEKKINPRTGKPTVLWNDRLKLIEKNLEFADLYAKFTKELQERGLYDYDDMIMLVLRKLESDEDFRATIQERFLYVHVDEYQDTNGSQYKLLKHLVDYDENPNLFVVGDEDQAIYAFQGANIRNLLDFKENYPNAEIISTKFNYRSQQFILDAAKNLIANNTERFSNYYSEVEKDLIAANRKPSGMQKIESVSLANNFGENQFIYERVQKLIDLGANPEQIAVIYHNHKDADDLINLFLSKNIPLNTQKSRNILHDRLVLRLINFINAIQDPTDNYTLLKLINLPVWDLDQLDLLKLAGSKILGSEGYKLIDLVMNENDLTLVGIKNIEKVLESGKRFLELRQEYLEERPSIVIEKIVQELNLLSDISIDEIHAIYALIRFARSREIASNYKYELKDFQDDIAKYDNANLAISLPKIFNSKKGVRLLTAHSAKGLEFEHVIIMKALNKHWNNKRKSDNFKLIELTKQVDTIEDDRRLFYVAVTRAQDSVLITHAQNYLDLESDKEKSTNVTPFVSELGSANVEEKAVEESETDLSYLLVSVDQRLDSKSFDPEDPETRDYLSRLIEKYSLSYTSWNDYLECPKRFLYKHVLRFPFPKGINQIIGTSVHKCIEVLINRNNGILLNYDRSKQLTETQITEIINSIEKIAVKTALREGLSQAKVNALKDKVISQISNFLSSIHELIPGNSEIFAVEKSLAAAIEIEGTVVQMKGKIDLIEKVGNALRFADFKTGKEVSRNKLLGMTNSTDKFDALPLRQLSLYYILGSNTLTNPIERLGLRYLQSKSLGKLKTDFTPDELPLAEIKKDIASAWNDIQQLKFERSCNKSNCDVCAAFN